MRTLFLIILLFAAQAIGQVASSVGTGKSQPSLIRKPQYPQPPQQHNHPTSPLLYEDFENPSGYDLAGWGEDLFTPATINPDNTTNVLYGTQSLAIDESNDDQCYLTNSFTAQDHAWLSFLFRPMNAPDSADTGVIRFTDASENCQLKFTFNSDGEPRVQFGCTGPVYQPAATMSSGTTYQVWIEYHNDNGANSFVTMAFSTTGVRPTSGDNFVSATGVSTATQVSRVLIGRPGSENGSEIDFIMDHLLVDDEQIVDYP